MEKTLRDLANLHRVVGAFVCDASGSLLAAEPAALAGAREAAKVGRTLAASAASLGGDPGRREGGLELCFEGGCLLLWPAGPEASLALVCEPNADTALLGVRAAEAAAAIAGAIGRPRPEAPGAGQGARVRSILEETLGSHAEKPVALVASAGGSPEKLAAAAAEAVKFARLFLGKDRAEELRTRLGEALGQKA